MSPFFFSHSFEASGAGHPTSHPLSALASKMKLSLLKMHFYPPLSSAGILSLATGRATFIEAGFFQATHRRVDRSNGDADTTHRESVNITSCTLGSTIAITRAALAGKRFRVEVHLKSRETVFVSSRNVGTVRDRAKPLWPELLGIPSKTREVSPLFKTPSSNIGG